MVKIKKSKNIQGVGAGFVADGFVAPKENALLLGACCPAGAPNVEVVAGAPNVEVAAGAPNAEVVVDGAPN